VASGARGFDSVLQLKQADYLLQLIRRRQYALRRYPSVWVAECAVIRPNYGMKSLEEFKATREKMDPSTHKMSAHQWEQAYAAYRSSREHARSGRSSSSARGRRKQSSNRSGTPGMHGPSTLSASGTLKACVRAESAYADLRLMINLLAWILLGAVVIVALLQVIVVSSLVAFCVALLTGAIQALGVVLFKLIVHVLIDIPDIALYRASQAQRSEVADESSTRD